MKFLSVTIGNETEHPSAFAEDGVTHEHVVPLLEFCADVADADDWQLEYNPGSGAFVNGGEPLLVLRELHALSICTTTTSHIRIATH